MTELGFVTGLRAEAGCLDGLAPRPLTACSGARPERATRAAAELIERGARVLVSFGLGGGLAPSLQPGALVLAETVVAPDGLVTATDPDHCDRLAALAQLQGLALHRGAIAGSETAVDTAAAKRALYQATAAVAVDMESHRVAAVAAAHQVKFLVLRAVADPALRAIPPPALVGIDPEGQTRPLAVMLALLAAPWHLPAVLRLAGDSQAGMKALRRAAELFRGF